ncbi:hypothetical protein ACMFMG_011606 [Clarireedia jacksonii]
MDFYLFSLSNESQNQITEFQPTHPSTQSPESSVTSPSAHITIYSIIHQTKTSSFQNSLSTKQHTKIQNVHPPIPIPILHPSKTQIPNQLPNLDARTAFHLSSSIIRDAKAIYRLQWYTGGSTFSALRI